MWTSNWHRSISISIPDQAPLKAMDDYHFTTEWAEKGGVLIPFLCLKNFILKVDLMYDLLSMGSDPYVDQLKPASRALNMVYSWLSSRPQAFEKAISHRI